MAIEVQFTEEDWARIRRDWTAWWAGELDRPLVVLGGWEPREGLPEAPGFASNLPDSVSAAEAVARYGAHLACARWYGDAWPKWWPNFGPGIAAGFLGARVHSVPETVWFEPAEAVAIRDLRLAYDADNPWWVRVREMTREAVAQWGDRVSVGHTDLGGNLDILASFRTTERLLYEALDEPEEVARLVGDITRLWIRYYDELDALIQPAGRGTTPWAALWSPARGYMLQCDFSYMISPEMFEAFVLPDLAACCDVLDHGFYHLDGKGQLPHLELLLSLERLRGIQWVPGDGMPPAEAWLPVLKRIRDAGKLCQLYVTPEGARTITRELGGKGFAFGLFGSFTREDADALCAELATGG